MSGADVTLVFQDDSSGGAKFTVTDISGVTAGDYTDHYVGEIETLE